MKKNNNEIIRFTEEKSLEIYYSPKSAGRVFLYSTVLSLVLSYIYYVILNLAKVDINNLNFMLMCINLFMGSLAFFLAVGKIKLDSKLSLKNIFNMKEKTPWYLYIVGAAMAIGLVLLTSNFINLIDIGLQALGFSNSGMNLEITNIGQFFLGILFICVLPAVVEELTFRGIILKSVKRRGLVLGVFVSAICFTIMHGSIYQTVFQFMLGLTLAYVVSYTGDIKLGMVMHFLNNFVIVLNSYIFSLLGKTAVYPTITPWFIISAILMLIAASAIVVGGVFLIRYVCKKKQIGEFKTLAANNLAADKFASHEAEINIDEKKLQEKTELKKNKYTFRKFINEYSYLGFVFIISAVLWIFNTVSLLK